MSPNFATLPTTDNAMWRKLLARVHPDAGEAGDHELFVWVMSVRETICDGKGSSGSGGASAPPPPPPRREPPPKPPPSYASTEPDCVPFETSLTFHELTIKAMKTASDPGVPPLYADLLKLLADCEDVSGDVFASGGLRGQQTRGASYKQLAAIGYKVAMSKPQRVRWYRLAESIPLSMRHAGHILSELSGGF